MPITIEEHFNTTPVCPLYHYTSPASCIGIIKNREFWATQIQYMNDSKEVQQAVDIARHVLRFQFRGKGSDDLHSFMNKALDDEDGANTFVISFSEVGDQLSQWRAYCPEGGMSLGFDPEKMKRLIDHDKGFKFVQCVYDREKQQTLVRETIQKCFDEHNNLPSHKSDHVRAFVHRVFRPDLRLIASSIKHHTFSEEREWRLVGGPIRFGHSDLDWRAGRDTIIPYYKFQLGKVPPLISARSGPSREPDFADKAILSLLASQDWFKEIPNLQLSGTETPLRIP